MSEFENQLAFEAITRKALGYNTTASNQKALRAIGIKAYREFLVKGFDWYMALGCARNKMEFESWKL